MPIKYFLNVNIFIILYTRTINLIYLLLYFIYQESKYLFSVNKYY